MCRARAWPTLLMHDISPSTERILMTPRRWTLAVVCAATAMLMLDIAVVNTALEPISKDLHASLVGAKWIVDAYTLALAATVLSAGSLADRFGRRRLFPVGLSALHRSPPPAARRPGPSAPLDAARAVQGLGAAIMFAVSLAILADAFPGPASGGRRWPRTARPSARPSPSARSSAARWPPASAGAGSS